MTEVKLHTEKLPNYLPLTLLILVVSVMFGTLMGALIVGVSTLLVTTLAGGVAGLALALSLLTLNVTTGVLYAAVVPLWAVVGGWQFALSKARRMSDDSNHLGLTLFSETHAIHRVVNRYGRQLGLPKICWIGWFDDDSINAFAMGLHQHEAIIGFSKGAVQKLSKEEFEAVICHELAHVASHDISRMTYAYGVRQSLTWFLVLRGLQRFARWVFTPLSELELMRFSRQREFWADAIGAHLTSREAMASALRKIELDADQPSDALADSAHFLFNGRFQALLATHPAVSKRIAAVEQQLYSERLGRAVAPTNPVREKLRQESELQNTVRTAHGPGSTGDVH